jgi:DNA processing protein
VTRPDGDVESLLALVLTPGLGPVLTARLLEAMGDAERALGASAAQLMRIRGIGETKAARIAPALRDARGRSQAEIERAAGMGVRLIAIGSEGYPGLLAEIPDPPPVLYVLGELAPADLDRYPVAIVGSRRCTAYGIEQAERFSGVLARSGLTIVSGGARGIDTAAHRGAMRADGRTIAVLGCGLANRYPPDNAELFDKIADGRGALVSELPLATQPDSQNFPARNRLISGMSLGTIVIEAGRGSGALLTARHALEEHGREVMGVPGRVDSPASEGTLDLLRGGEAALVTSGRDVLDILEQPARHHWAGTHESRYADPARSPALGADEAAILEALDRPMSADELVEASGLAPGPMRAALTLLEMQGRIVRSGGRLERRTPG